MIITDYYVQWIANVRHCEMDRVCFGSDQEDAIVPASSKQYVNSTQSRRDIV